MRNLFVILGIVILILAGCIANDSNKTPIKDSKNPPQVNLISNGFEPENEIEEKYFQIIGHSAQWKSFSSDFTYMEQLYDEEEIEQEIYSTSRFVLDPFQLHRTYHSVHFQNDNLEVYATEDEAYENRHFTKWEKASDHSVYSINPIPIRTELLYRLMDGAEELYEVDKNIVTFSIEKKSWEDLSKAVQLAYFNNMINYDSTSDLGLDGLLKPLSDIEGFEVKLETDGKQLVSIDILISFNRLDKDSVDQLHFHEKFSDINSFTSIDIPNEVKGK